jgi:hypothetical protein
MVEIMSLVTGLGLSLPAGLNAYIPLLVVALLARFTNLITLQSPYNVLTEWPVIIVLAILLVVEMVADKIPGVDNVNDMIQTIIRPTAGAFLFLSTQHVISDVNPVLAVIIGLLAAGSVHAVKATARPAVTVTTLGLGNSVVSASEDVVALVTSLLAILAPAIALLLFLALLLLVTMWYFRRKQPARAVRGSRRLGE